MLQTTQVLAEPRGAKITHKLTTWWAKIWVIFLRFQVLQLLVGAQKWRMRQKIILYSTLADTAPVKKTQLAIWPTYGVFDKRPKTNLSSNSHWHQDVPILHILVRIFGPHLACALGVLELQPHLPGIPDRLQEIDQVLTVETHH
jgi:hypothetical protein